MRLLVLSYAFPPSRHANAKRPHYLVQGFLDAGWEVDLFTLRIGMAPGTEETVRHPGLRILRCEDPIAGAVERAAGRPKLQRLLSLAAAGGLWPDGFVAWSLRAMRASRDKGRYDRVLAFIYPPSLLLCGLAPGLVDSKWIFDYQESVTPQRRLFPKRSLLHRALAPCLARLERRTLHKAGRVVFTANTNREAYVRAGLVPEAGAAHVPYFFDAVAFRSLPDLSGAAFEIAYFGTFDWTGARSPEVFLRALARFLELRPEARPATRFRFYGGWLPEHNRLIEELKLQDRVAIEPPVGYQRYIELVKQSPILLLVVASAHNLFMPSKIVDYFGARRPIMAFVPRGSEMRRVLEQAGMAEFASDELDVEGGVAALERLWQRHLAGSLAAGGAKVDFWSSTVQIPRYLELASVSI